MRPFHVFTGFLAILLLFAAITPGVSAFTLPSVKVEPQGYQPAGTLMTVSFTIDFSKTGNATFPSDGELLMNTNLANAQWVPVLVLNGVDTSLPSKNGNSLVLPGWYVSYPSTQDVHIRGTLTGTMPENPSADLNFLKIQELDSGSAVVSTARLEMPAPPVTSLPTPTTKPATVTFTPIPTDTTPQKSSPGVGAGIIALCGAALLVTRRR